MPKSRRKPSRPAPAGRTSLPDIETPYNILRSVRAGEITEKQLRDQYTVLRDRSQKQLKRMMGSQYSVPERWADAEKRGAFWKLSELRDVREIAYALNDLQEFINAPSASVSGRKAQERITITTLHEHGYTGINKQNVGQFGKFMEKMRDRMGGRRAYPSGDLAQFFSDSKAQGWSIPVSETDLLEAFLQWQAKNAV